jgi:hypothetical protein
MNEPLRRKGALVQVPRTNTAAMISVTANACAIETPSNHQPAFKLREI